MPETDADRLIKFGNVWDLENPRRGRTVWMVSHPFKGRTKSEIRMKRRVVQRQSDIRRRRARQWHKENDEERGYETDLNDDERGYEADFE